MNRLLCNFSVLAVCLLLLVVTFSVPGFCARSRIFSGARTAELTYFFGARGAGDTLCYERTISKGSNTPVQIQYTSPTARAINFVTVNADQYHKYGFRVFIERGAIATATLSFRLTGKRTLPYNIVFQFWCAP
ncbi:uncharacterized protein LOC129769075 [Toxorhynchites rutilus septentrionalis]|uniref:uncharacterized protein LOC129769075 n=1 Tax=Toxorhynchites rutilus septentrionalis TaxID=329112 RepID=UPI00247A4328|nr:uncharacterized protein LOC129769075 [Toxorhynchites rutilus septentrionalis]